MGLSRENLAGLGQVFGGRCICYKFNKTRTYVKNTLKSPENPKIDKCPKLLTGLNRVMCIFEPIGQNRRHPDFGSGVNIEVTSIPSVNSANSRA